MRLNWPPRMGDERGVTLTEVLVAIIVLSVISLPLGNAVIGFIRMTDDTTVRLSESHDVQIAAAYFAQDVRSLGTRDWAAYPYPLRQSVERGAAATGGRYPCGGPTTPVAVARIAWDDPTAATTLPQVIRVSYVVVPASGESQLHRITCVGSATPVTDLTLAHHLDPNQAPTVECLPDPTCVVPPTWMRLNLAIRDPSTTGAPLVVPLTGQRRQT